MFTFSKTKQTQKIFKIFSTRKKNEFRKCLVIWKLQFVFMVAKWKILSRNIRKEPFSFERCSFFRRFANRSLGQWRSKFYLWFDWYCIIFTRLPIHFCVWLEERYYFCVQSWDRQGKKKLAWNFTKYISKLKKINFRRALPGKPKSTTD